MTKIKFCGMTRPEDILAANALRPDLIGFVFAKQSRRYVSPERARELRALLSPEIPAVGVFVDEAPEQVAKLLEESTIQIAQLHGSEDEEYIVRLRSLTAKPTIKAFQISSPPDIARAEESSADLVLLDSGAGTGRVFDWSLLQNVNRPYFLAGGLGPENALLAVKTLSPYGLDVSSGIETDGRKDKEKMAAFISAVRKEETL